MNDEIRMYEKNLSSFGVVQKPQMPKIDTTAYTDNEYIRTVFELLKDFDKIDDEYLTIDHLKGE